MKWKDRRQTAKGKYVTKACFAELPRLPGYEPTFTLSADDHDGLLSMEKLFLSYYTDPTEYLFVQEVFEGDFKHWEEMKTGVVMKEYYEDWKQKALKKLQSEVMQKLIESAIEKNNVQAIKYLLDMQVEKTKVGRPKKEKKVEEVDQKDLLADIARLKA